MGKLRVQMTDDWWLTYGEPSANPGEDSALLIRGLTQIGLSETIRKATKQRWQKNPAGQWIPDGQIDMAHLIDGLKAYIVDWRGVVDAGGQPLEFSEERLDRALNTPGMVDVLIRSVLRTADAQAEQDEAVVKN